MIFVVGVVVVVGFSNRLVNLTNSESLVVGTLWVEKGFPRDNPKSFSQESFPTSGLLGDSKMSQRVMNPV